MITPDDIYEFHLTSSIRSALSASAEKINNTLSGQLDSALPFSGKMLRSLLGIKLFQANISDLSEDDLISACAAVELVHTASLCHDDVIDEAVLRRHKPTLWQSTSRSSAILIGDILLCDALKHTMSTAGKKMTNRLLDKAREVCCIEAEQELCLRDKHLTVDDCLRVARGKTGPLFAFIGAASAGSNSELAEELEESGYLIGTAYQLTDDLVDLLGSEETTGKTTGNDVEQNKHTLAQEWRNTPQKLIQRIEGLLQAAESKLTAHPEASRAIKNYLETDLKPTFNQSVTCSDISL